MFSMIDKPGRASTSTSRPSLSVTTSLTMNSLGTCATRGRDYNRRRVADRDRGGDVSARVVRIEAAAALARALALHRRMAGGRFCVGLLAGFRFRVAGFGGAALRVLLG